MLFFELYLLYYFKFFKIKSLHLIFALNKINNKGTLYG